MKRWAALLVTALAIAGLVSHQASHHGHDVGHYQYLALVTKSWNGNWLSNPGFEVTGGGTCEWYGCLRVDVDVDEGREYCAEWMGPIYSCFVEQTCPESWTCGWRDRGPCGDLDDDYRTGRPECKPAEAWEDPGRICEGERSALCFNFFRCNDLWWSQAVEVPAGVYQAGASFQVWREGEQWLRVCLIGSTGLTTSGSTDVCSPWLSPEDCQEIMTSEIELSGPATVRIECWSAWPYRNNNCYVDDVWLRRRE